jgi:TRAP transporter TAXI family solute receptor
VLAQHQREEHSMSRPGLASAASRRGLLGAAAGSLLAGGLSACATHRDTGTPAGPWHHGRLYLATGNTTGVFYQIGGGYADIITAHLPGYEATAEPTNAAVDNIRRLVRGDADIAFTFADAAADAVRGRPPFAGTPQRIVALARIYNSYTHVIARTGTGVRGVSDLRGRRISTGSPGSGSELVALRVLSAAGLDPDRDVRRQALSLPETVKAMRAGSLDAMFWTGGLPAIGISDLLRTVPDRLVFLPVVDLLPGLRKEYGDAYSPATIGRGAYGQPADVPTIAVGSMVTVLPELPDDLAYQLTRLLFDYQNELAAAHPEGHNYTREAAPHTEPVPLHPGAHRYY